MKYRKELTELLTKSPCKKRKVAAIIVDADGMIIGSGYNHRNGKPCEDAAGASEADVVHAEIAAIDSVPPEMLYKAEAIYVTHPPCANCQYEIAKSGIEHVHVVETFIKFDGDKPRFDLVPAEWQLGDAQILTFGARKYKPNNWRHVDDIGRYIAALERHLNEFKQALETKDYKRFYDEETGLHHMKHLRTNAGFLLTLTEERDDYRT